MSAYLVRSVLSIVVRLICLAFVVLAAFAVPNAWSLTQEQDYVLEGSTLYIPLRICEPRSISFGLNTTVYFFEEPQAISVDANNTANATDSDTTADQNVKNDDDLQCHTLDNLINACVLSIIFAMAATLIFFVFDAMAYYKKVRAGVAMGMTLFLVLILIMASASCYAMYQEMTYWQEHFEKLFHDMAQDNNYGVEEVKPHGNKLFVALTFIAALIAAGAVLVDTLIIFCCGENIKPASKPPVQPAPSEQAIPSTPADASAETSPPQSTEEEPPMGTAGGKPAWTNV